MSVVSSKTLMIISVQHTGTWRLLNWLRTHPDLNHFAFIHNLGRLSAGEMDDNPHKESLAPCGRWQLLHEHLGYTDCQWNWKSFDEYGPFSFPYPAIVPLRDPLQSLITRHRRQPELYPHEDLLASWRHLVRPEYMGWNFVPIDPWDPSRLESALLAAGLGENPDWLRTLDPSEKANTCGDYPLKTAYENGDLKYIYQQMPLTLMALKRHESKLRRFLESQGYRDLIWYRN